MGLSKRVLTIVFTDVIGSTALKGALGDLGYARRMERHRAFHRMLLGAFDNAEEVETAGDSMLLVFERPSDAVAYALRARDSLRAEPDGIRDRFALHLGEIVSSDHASGPKRRDLFSIHVDVASRMLALSETDRILMSRVVYDSARYHLRGAHLGAGEQHRWTRHGLYAFKGVDEPMEVCEVSPATEPPPERPPDSDKAVCVVPGSGALSATPMPVGPAPSLPPMPPPEAAPSRPSNAGLPGPITAVAGVFALLAGLWAVSADRSEHGVAWPVVSDDDVTQHHADAGIRAWLLGDLEAADRALAAAIARDPKPAVLHLVAAAVAVGADDTTALYGRVERADEAAADGDEDAELAELVAASYTNAAERTAWLAERDTWLTRHRTDDFGRLLLAAANHAWPFEPALVDHAAQLAAELPDVPVACATAADQLLRTGLAARAIAVLDPCVDRHPQVAVLRALRGEGRRLVGDAVGARADLYAAIELDPGQLGARLSLLRLASAERDLALADQLEDSLDDVLLPVPHRIAALRGLAAVAVDEGRFGAAVHHLELAASLAEQVQDAGRAVQVRRDLARLAWVAGGPDQAERYLAEVEQAAAAPEVTPLERETATSEVLGMRVHAAVLRGELGQAGRLLARLEQLPPERFGVYPKERRLAAARLLIEGSRSGEVDTLAPNLRRCDRLWLAVELGVDERTDRATELADPQTPCDPDFSAWRRAVAAAQAAEARHLAGDPVGSRTALDWFQHWAPRADRDLPATQLAEQVRARLDQPLPFE